MILFILQAICSFTHCAKVTPQQKVTEHKASITKTMFSQELGAK